MERYRLNGRLYPVGNEVHLQSDDVFIEIMKTKEFEELHKGMVHEKFLMKSLRNPQYCKAEVMKNCIVGTFVIPSKEHLLTGEMTCGFYLTETKLVFVDESNAVKSIIDEMTEIQLIEKTFVGHFLFEFLEYLIRDDVIFLQKFEEKLSAMEEEILEKDIADFNKKIMTIRRELLVLESYYRQIQDLSDTLDEHNNRLLSDEDHRLFGFFSARVSRLCENVMMLKEYSVQLREMYQSQIDIRQNKIMQFLTVVTTIFMPLTLIAGWYGMNFIDMPELKYEYGYYVVIGVSVLTVVLEAWYFKVKKWFD